MDVTIEEIIFRFFERGEIPFSEQKIIAKLWEPTLQDLIEEINEE